MQTKKKISKLVYTQAWIVDATTFGKMFTSTLLIWNVLCHQWRMSGNDLICKSSHNGAAPFVLLHPTLISTFLKTEGIAHPDYHCMMNSLSLLSVSADTR